MPTPLITDPPLFADITEAGDALAGIGTSYALAVGQSFEGSLTLGDRDWVAVTLTAGEVYDLALTGLTLTDPYLRLYDSSGALIREDNNGATFSDARLTFRAPTTGTYYLAAAAENDDETGSYELSVAPLPTYTAAQIADQLVHGYQNWRGNQWRAFDVSEDMIIDVDITGLTAEGQVLATHALEAWTMVTGLSFNFVSSGAEITFDDEDSGAYASTTYSGNEIISVDVNISTGWLTNNGTELGSYSFGTYIHEIGHALGLGHAGNYNFSATYDEHNLYLNDSRQMTVMSYFSQYENTEVDASWAVAVTPMMADILAIQSLYGTPVDQRAGDTVYGENSNTGSYLDVLNSPPNAITLTLFDSGGFDTINLTSDTFDQVWDLTPGGFSSVSGLTGILGIALNTVIEAALAGSGDDQILGNAAHNRLEGNGGDDSLQGVAGQDTLLGGAGHDSLSGGADNDLLGGGTGHDTLAGDEGADSLFGSEGDDTLMGGAGHDLLGGGGDDDLLGGGAGNDSLYGATGGDRLFGAAGQDSLFGEAGHDLLYGGADQDLLNGGSGHDSLYGEAGDDTLMGESGNDVLGGGAGNDLLGGGGGHDALYGADGADQLYGAAGHDSLSGGAGADTLTGGSGVDLLTGGAGADLFDFNLTSDSHVGARDRIADFQIGVDRVDLAGIDANSGLAGNQAFSFIDSAGFSAAGQLRFVTNGSDGFALSDVNGDGAQDWVILLTGVTNMSAADFIL